MPACAHVLQHALQRPRQTLRANTPLIYWEQVQRVHFPTWLGCSRPGQQQHSHGASSIWAIHHISPGIYHVKHQDNDHANHDVRDTRIEYQCSARMPRSKRPPVARAHTRYAATSSTAQSYIHGRHDTILWRCNNHEVLLQCLERQASSEKGAHWHMMRVCSVMMNR